jgi:hypothetical protein
MYIPENFKRSAEMKRKLTIRSFMLLFILSLFGLFSLQVSAQSENLKLDSLKANFSPGERYFLLGKRDPFVPLVSPVKKRFKSISSKSLPPKKERSNQFKVPSEMPLIPIKVFEKVKTEHPRMADQLYEFASIFNDESALNKLSSKEYKKKVSAYRSLLSEILNMRGDMFIPTKLQIGFEKIKFVGTFRKEGTTLALIQTEGGRGHIVKAGTLIGPNLGIVKTVDKKKIIILERYRNYIGETLSRPRNIEFKKNRLND